MIPPFYDGENLPIGRHECTMEEVGLRFGNGEKRQELFERLRVLVGRATDCGFRAVVIFGSFISSKVEPGDVDLFWVTEGNIDTERLRAECRDLLDTMAVKRQFGFDAFWCADDGGAIDRMTDLWAQDRQLRPRGLIMIDLSR